MTLSVKLISVLFSTMVRAQLKSKAAIKQKPKETKSTKRQKTEKNKFIPAENQSSRITRSNSQFVKIENTTKNQAHGISPRKTRSKSKVNILPLSHISPRKTRSKSENIQSIDFHLDSKHQESVCLEDKKQQQTKICVRSEFVKTIDFKLFSIVLAKQKYSVPWPAKVLKIEKERVFVHFYGDNRSGYVHKSEIYDFLLSMKAVKTLLQSKKNPHTYRKGIREIEGVFGIPADKTLVHH